MPPAWLNRSFHAATELERRLAAAGLAYPAGGSVLAIASRRGQRHRDLQLRSIQADIDFATLLHGSSPMREALRWPTQRNPRSSHTAGRATAPATNIRSVQGNRGQLTDRTGFCAAAQIREPSLDTGRLAWSLATDRLTATWQTVCSSPERWLVPQYATSEGCAG